MIKNERQLRIAERKHRDLSAALESDKKQLAAMPADQAQVLRRGAEHVIDQLVREIIDYRELQDEPPQVVEYRSLDDLPDALIRARIASRLTQAELAERVGIHENQVQKYEATGYQAASLARLRDIASAMPVLAAAARQEPPSSRRSG